MCRIMRYFGLYDDFTINEMSEFVLNECAGRGDCVARPEATIVPIDNIGLDRVHLQIGRIVLVTGYPVRNPVGNCYDWNPG